MRPGRRRSNGHSRRRGWSVGWNHLTGCLLPAAYRRRSCCQPECQSQRRGPRRAAGCSPYSLPSWPGHIRPARGTPRVRPALPNATGAGPLKRQCGPLCVRVIRVSWARRHSFRLNLVDGIRQRVTLALGAEEAPRTGVHGVPDPKPQGCRDLIATRLLIGIGLVDVADAALTWVGLSETEAGISSTSIAEVPENVNQ